MEGRKNNNKGLVVAIEECYNISIMTGNQGISKPQTYESSYLKKKEEFFFAFEAEI